MMFKIAALALLALPSVSASLNIKNIVKDCKGYNDNHKYLAITDVEVLTDLGPWPPQIGSYVDLVISVIFPEVITSGTYNAMVTWFSDSYPDGIPGVSNKTGNLGNLVHLPTTLGPKRIQTTVPIPSSIPPGNNTFTFKAGLGNGDYLICFETDQLNFTPPRTTIVHNLGFEDAADVKVPVPHTSCGTDTDVLKIISLASSTWPPVAGQALTLVGSIMSSEDILWGTASFDVFLLDGETKLYEITSDLPEIAAGLFTIARTFTLPSLRSGLYVLSGSATNRAGKQLGCVKISFNL